MNREIKFRVWTKEEMLYEGWNKDFFVTKEIIFRYDNVMQYTGLKDKNGKECYEGDIVKGVTGYIFQIVFLDGSFCMRSNSDHPLANKDFCMYQNELTPDFMNMRFYEIIGNIYESPREQRIVEGL